MPSIFPGSFYPSFYLYKKQVKQRKIRNLEVKQPLPNATNVPDAIICNSDQDILFSEGTLFKLYL